MHCVSMVSASPLAYVLTLLASVPGRSCYASLQRQVLCPAGARGWMLMMCRMPRMKPPGCCVGTTRRRSGEQAAAMSTLAKQRHCSLHSTLEPIRAPGVRWRPPKAGWLACFCRFATPMRTPRTATVSGQDRIMQQARDASRLQQGQTPLLGGENAVQIERGDFGNSVAPPTVGHATPHPLLGATPGATPRAIAGVSSTPSVAGTPLRTPGKLYAEPVSSSEV